LNSKVSCSAKTPTCESDVVRWEDGPEWKVDVSAVGPSADLARRQKARTPEAIARAQAKVVAADQDMRPVEALLVQASRAPRPGKRIRLLLQDGNSLSGEVWSRWYTPAHMLGGWSQRLAERRRAGLSQSDEAERGVQQTDLPSRAWHSTNNAAGEQKRLF
jgi:hypothetical protein